MAWKRWQDWINLILGIWLIISTWVYLFPEGGGATITFWVGVGVALIAIWALGMPELQVAEWCQILLEAGYFFAPWVFGFAGEAGGGDWNAWIVSVIIVILAASALSTAGRTAGHASARA